MNFLKRLELSGFKSFAQRTVLEFPSGITAIVGPNGSGKSNVVDAVRWLLGEREAKYLRGAKVEDLIFAGTVKRPRMGQAQAALYFDNSKKFFPVEFAEVSVMRQIARSGTSKYFLNKSEILLRDLVDFFAKARLGSRGLVVVTQGNSDVFIQASPAERREMIEEILGLREYQIKKNDAERRLKNSQINLDKARALVEEILPHLRSLRRQTSRWEKRGELEEELRLLEDRFFGSQLAEIKEKVSELDGRIGEDRTELEKLQKEKNKADEKLVLVEKSQPLEKEELKKIKERAQKLIAKRGELEKSLGRLEAQIEMGRSALRADRPISEILEAIKEIKTELRAALAGDFVELRSAIESALDRIDEILDGGKSGKEADGVPVEMKSLLDKTQGELGLLDQEMADMKAEEKRLETGQEEFYGAFKAAVAEVEAAKDRIEKWELRNKELLFSKERLDLRREDLERQIEQAGRRPQEFYSYEKTGGAADLKEAEKRIFKLRGDLASMGEVDEAIMKEAKDTENRYQLLKQESEDLEKAMEDLRALIRDLTEQIRVKFEKSLAEINGEFHKFFETMFGGGQARLKLEPSAKGPGPGSAKRKGGDSAELDGVPDDEADGIEEEEGLAEKPQGVLIDVKLPRKKLTSLEMLSGGERSLVGIAALFALISVSTPPFLVLDEIDAALDDRNARRFAGMLKEFSKKTQFVIVTHNRATMEAADILYGVTLNDDGTSKLVSLKLES